MQKIIKKCAVFCLTAMLLLSTATSLAVTKDELISVFPLDHYSQNLSDWINPNSPDYNTPLLSAESQKQRQTIYYNRYFGAASPWDGQHVNRIIQSEPAAMKSIEKDMLAIFSNENKSADEIGYGENYRPHSSA